MSLLRSLGQLAGNLARRRAEDAMFSASTRRNLASRISGMAGTSGAAGGLGALIENARAHVETALGGDQADDDLKARLILRAMILAAQCDGHIDDTERDAILEHLGDATAEDRAFVTAQMSAVYDLDGFLRDVPDDHALKVQIYTMSLLTIEVDTAEEAAHLRALAAGLGLSDDEVNAAEDAMGLGLA